jgi:hypothetical protein
LKESIYFLSSKFGVWIAFVILFFQRGFFYFPGSFLLLPRKLSLTGFPRLFTEGVALLLLFRREWAEWM